MRKEQNTRYIKASGARSWTQWETPVQGARSSQAMRFIKCRIMCVVWVWALAAALVSAQITFSRDWTGGKRAAPHLALDCNQFTRLCKHFVHELKQTMSIELGSKRQREEMDKPPLYDDE